ncbi:hypothetical protein PAPYR_8237 [Paratrimastix pyriformis]|uniref:Uncharacterized protein n=1 Tax=Paratrimastix pyriformis TaxID=342808 RepID=A0ABQ8UGG7_9EUKA|nr:hypothetical protein PAPYR_8237 [Paratrimastix pyriformis]
MIAALELAASPRDRRFFRFSSQEKAPLEGANEAKMPPAHAVDQDNSALAKFPLLHLEINSGKSRRAPRVFLSVVSRVFFCITLLWTHQSILYMLILKIIVIASKSQQRECQKPPKTIQFLPEPIWLGATPLMLDLMRQERCSEPSGSDDDSSDLGD